jgi:hypothetical protein
VNTFRCEICGCEVSKRQSYQYGQGRACKKHQEANEANNEKQNILKSHLKEDLRKASQKHSSHDFSNFRIGPQCWGCHCNGFMLQDFYAQMLISMEKVQMREQTEGKSFNIIELMNESRKDAFETLGSNLTVLVPYPVSKNLVHDVCRATRASHGLVSLAECIVLCKTCADKAKLVYKPPKLSTEQLYNWASVSDMMRPQFQEAAKIQMKLENG